jgi:hypothetical protein
MDVELCILDDEKDVSGIRCSRKKSGIYDEMLEGRRLD